jgi:hypothetical protein
MQIWFNIKGFPVNVSTHGYFEIYSRKVPTIKFSSCPNLILACPIDVLEGIKYLPEYDDINVDLTDQKLFNALKDFVEENLKDFEKKDEELCKKWEEIKKEKKLIIKGKEIRIGDYVELDGKIVKILWFDEKRDELCFSEKDNVYSTNLSNKKYKIRKLSEKEAVIYSL